MPRSKRPAAEAVEESLEVVEAKGRKKKSKVVDSPKKSTVPQAAKEKAAAVKESTTKAAVAKKSTNKKTETKPESSKKAATRTPNKAKEENTVATEEADEETPSSPTKKKRATKAKQSDVNDGPISLSAPPPGGSKMDTLAAPELPKNTAITDPVVLDNTPKAEGTTRIMSWNVLSLKSSLGKGLMRYIEAEQADLVILTETKCNDVPMLPALAAIYPHQTWGIGKTKGYAGIALLSKTKPLKVTVGLPEWEVDTKGRIITAEYETYIVIGTYVVNAGEGLKTLPQKQEWNDHLAKHLATCDARKPTIWTGDLNVVLDARDLSNASKKWQKSAGYTSIECDHHRRVLEGTAYPGALPYVDIWREKHPDAVGHYTYFGFRGFCRTKGIGWRLDSFIVPKRIAHLVEACEIRHTIYGASDHVPVYMDIKDTM